MKSTCDAGLYFFLNFYLIQTSLIQEIKKKSSDLTTGFFFVPTTGFEPAHQMAPPPQDGMSTNFTTWALLSAKIMKTKRDTLVE